jgi:hypothetical protein
MKMVIIVIIIIAVVTAKVYLGQDLDFNFLCSDRSLYKEESTITATVSIIGKLREERLELME